MPQVLELCGIVKIIWGKAHGFRNPLKKMQAVVAVACKILRIFYVILTKGVDYDPEKMLGDIQHPQIQAS